MPKIREAATADIREHLWSLYWLVRSINATRIVELGVRSGDSTRALVAAAMDVGGRVQSYDIDGDAYRVEEVTAKHGIEAFPDGLWNCHKYDSVEAANLYSNWTLDFLFVDTVHSLEHTMNEITAWIHTLRPGGIMAFHDVGLNEPGRDGVLKSMEFFFQNSKSWDMETHVHVADGDCGLGWAIQKGGNG